MMSRMQLHVHVERLSEAIIRARVQQHREAEGDSQRHNTLPRFPRGSSCMPHTYMYALVTVKCEAMKPTLCTSPLSDM